MPFGPIIDRELRIRARSRTTFWLRVIGALVGLLFCFQQLVVTASLRTPAALGRNVFDGIVTAAFLFGCSACMLTADAISNERREGTLGLLFLTGVRSLDVVAGKLASAGLTSLCGMVALLPALVLPLLAGGVGGPEITRKGLALVATLWFALGAGLCGSALQRDRTKAVSGAFLITLTIILAPFLAFTVIRSGALHLLGAFSPLVLMIAAGEPLFTSSPLWFWASLALVQALGWLFLIGAGLLLHRAVRSDSSAVIKPLTAKVAEARKAIGFGRWQPDREDSDPVEWLVFRGRGVSAAVWLGAVLGLVVSRSMALVLPFFGRQGGPVLWLVAWPLGVGGALVGGAMVALVATRFLARARRTGELELLLTSPVGARTLISDQWRVLSRVFLWPVLVLQLAAVLPLVLAGGIRGSSMTALFIFAPVNLVNTGLGVAALCWVGMRYGLKARGPAAAIITTVALAQGVPWIIIMVTGVIPVLPDLILLPVYAVLLASAREHLFRGLTEGDYVSPDPVRSL